MTFEDWWEQDLGDGQKRFVDAINRIQKSKLRVHILTELEELVEAAYQEGYTQGIIDRSS